MAITPLPTPVPQRSDPTNFVARADTFLSALPDFATQANALAVEVEGYKDTVVSQIAAANAAGLGMAATNAATCTTKAVQVASDTSTAVAAKDNAVAAWSAALASNPDLNPAFRMNPSTILNDVTVPTGYNAFSSGPLTIGEGVEITINEYSNWSII